MPTAVVYHDLAIAERLSEGLADLTVVETDSSDATSEALADAEILVTNPTLWSDAFLDQLERGDWVQATSIGYAAFPVEEFTERGIEFSNAETLHDSVVSEHAFALALGLSRGVKTSTDRQRAREWDRSVGDGLWHWEGQQMTIFGLGNIGNSIARRARAFGFEVVGIKRTPAVYSGALPDHRVRSNDELLDVLPNTDLLMVAAPLNEGTHHAIDEEALAALPDTAVVVNVGRGAVIDQAALVYALETGALAGAGLDVFEDEPLPSDSPLWNRDDVIITPHVGGRSRDFTERFGRLFRDNYRRWTNGRDLVNRID